MSSLYQPPFGYQITTGPQILQLLKEIADDDIFGITCFGKTDGGGAQAVATMSVQLFCQLTNKNYYHSHFQNIMFFEGKENWDSQWEKFFNLGFDELRPPPDIRVLNMIDWLNQGRPKDVILEIPFCHNYIQSFYSANSFASIADRFRTKYWSSGKEKYEKLIENKDYLALHIRRGDVTAEALPRRFTGDSDILNTLTKFKEKVAFEGEIHVFSQGDESDFQFLQNIGKVKLFINTDIFESIHRMVNARYLIAAKSTVSYSAGILSHGKVFSDSWYHRPLDDWYSFSKSNIMMPYASIRSLKELETRIAAMVSRRTTEDDDEVIGIVERDKNLLQVSPIIQWLYAQPLLRRKDQKAYPLLLEIAKSDSTRASSAQRILDTHQKAGKITWPDGQ